MFNKRQIKNVNRQSLIIFVVLAVVFVAQLSWWIVFHFRLIDERYHDYLSYASSRQAELAESLSQEFQSARDLMLLNSENLSPSVVANLLGILEANRFVSRLVVTDGVNDTLLDYSSERFSKTQAVDAGVRLSKDGTIIIVSLDYSIARQLAESNHPKLEFIPPPQDSVFFRPIGIRNFRPHPEQVAAYEEEVRSSRMMLFSEGGFFIILTLVGLALIFRALARSEESRKMQENFLMAVTHELRSPLASLRLGMDGLKRGKLSEGNRDKVLRMVDTDLDRLAYLIDDLLEAGRISGKSAARSKSEGVVSLETFVQDYFASRKEEFASRDIVIALNVATNDSDHESQAGWSASYTMVRISAGDLTRCVDIAVDNAIKFSESETRIEVTVTSDNQTSVARLALKDFGVGLEKFECDRVFERFYRVGSELTRSRQGAGLGLYLAKKIIESSGGGIAIDSAGLGTGATVTLTLPLCAHRKLQQEATAGW